MTLNKRKSRIIIVGANFAGLSAASKLNKCHEVTVIDSNQDFQWTPNIHEILSDLKKVTNLSLNLATIVNRLGHGFVNQTVSSIDGELQTVTLENKEVLHYDALLIASGHIRSNYGVKGASKYAYGFRNANDAIQIHNNIETELHKTKEPININIIGGGFTGVEVLGELLRKYAKNKQLHFNVIDSASRLVQALPHKLSDDIVSQCMGNQVKFYFNQNTSEVKKSSIHFTDKTSLESTITIWTAGTQLPDYLDSAKVDSAKVDIFSNGIKVNSYLQSENFANVFVAGDSASLVKPLAKQASIAIDMGLHAGSNIDRFCNQKKLSTFKGSKKPVLLSLGDINTYFIQGNLVLASPLLATAKEAVYQLYMARLSTLLPLEQSISGLAGRLVMATDKMLLPEILKLRPRVILGRSKVLK